MKQTFNMEPNNFREKESLEFTIANLEDGGFPEVGIRLYYLISRLNLEGTSAENWSLKVTLTLAR